MADEIRFMVGIGQYSPEKEFKKQLVAVLF